MYFYRTLIVTIAINLALIELRRLILVITSNDLGSCEIGPPKPVALKIHLQAMRHVDGGMLSLNSYMLSRFHFLLQSIHSTLHFRTSINAHMFCALLYSLLKMSSTDHYCCLVEAGVAQSV